MSCNCNENPKQRKQIYAPTIECLKVHAVICTKTVQKVAELTLPFNQLMTGVTPPPPLPRPGAIQDPGLELDIVAKKDDELDSKPQLEAISEKDDELDPEQQLEVIAEKDDELDLEPQLDTTAEKDDELDLEPQLDTIAEKDDELDLEPQLDTIAEKDDELDLEPQLDTIAKKDDELDPESKLEAIPKREEELELIPEQKAEQDLALELDSKQPSELNADLEINAVTAVEPIVQYRVVPNPAGIVMRGTLINGKIVNSGYVPVTVTITGTAISTQTISINLPFQEETECPGACAGDDLQETQPIIEAIISPVFTPQIGTLAPGEVTFKVIIKTQITVSREKLVYAAVNVIEDINQNRCEDNQSIQATTKQFFGQ